MKRLFSVLICTILSFAICIRSHGQISVTNPTYTTPNLLSSYTTLALAIADLNAITAITGPVTIKVTTSAYAETAPAGGYQIIISGITNTSASPIVIDGDHKATITAFTPQPTGELYDGIFKIIGADYITIQKFNMQENASNTVTAAGTNNMTEWGVALLKASNINGAQFNSIIDNDISLNRTYPNSFGIYSNVRHAATAVGSLSDITNGTTGPNHSNVVYNNRISNVNMGIAFIGSNTDSRMDTFNDVGGLSSSTGNTITNWGGNSLATSTFQGNIATEYYGILSKCQKNNNVSWNTLVSAVVTGSVGMPLRGIHNATTTNTILGPFTTTIDHNTITITDNLPNGTGASVNTHLDGIFCGDRLTDATLSVSYNTITNLSVTATGSNRHIRGISLNPVTVATVYLNHNVIKGASSNATAAGGWFFGIDQIGNITDRLEIDNNSIGDATSLTPAITYNTVPDNSCYVRGINHVPTGNPNGTKYISISNNSLYGFVQSIASANPHQYINFDQTTTTNSDIHVDGNSFVNINAATAGDLTFISSSGTMATASSAQLSVSNNMIVGSFLKNNGSDVYIYFANGSSGPGNKMIQTGNNFSNITLTGATRMRGWYNNEGLSGAGPEKSISNNTFAHWTCGTTWAGVTNVIYCDWASSNSDISSNTISDITAPTDVNGILSASTTAITMAINNNDISDLKTLSSSGEMVGTNLTGLSTFTDYHNQKYTGTPPSGGAVYGLRITAATSSTNSIDYSYNSTYLTATGTVNTAALYVTASTAGYVYIRNSIFDNESTSTGRAAAIWWSASTMTNHTTVSDYNDFYVPSATNHSIFYNGTAYTLAGYQGLTSSNGHSLEIKPDFASTSLLTLKPAPSNYLILNGARNNGVSLGLDAVNADFQNDPRMSISPYISDIGRDQVNAVYAVNVWTGNAGGGDDDWGTPANWSLSTVPNSRTDNAYIPYVTPNPQPHIYNINTWQVANAYFEMGTAATKMINNEGVLQVADYIVGDADKFNNYDFLTSTDVVGSIEYNGSLPQILGGSLFKNHRVLNFTSSNNVTISPYANDGLSIVGQLDFGAASGVTLNTGPSTLTNNENITLISTPNTTACVAPIIGSNVITGDVTVERYINTGNVGNEHPRAWQYLSTPTTGQSVRQSWMEGMVSPGDNLHPGYGTNIPGGSNVLPIVGNYDQIYISGPGIKWWDYTAAPSGIFQTVSNTNNLLYNPRGYYLFVRGDRSVVNFSGANSSPIPTTLRQKGSLFQPNAGTSLVPAVTTIPIGSSAGLFVSVGNPYAAAIDLNAMVSGGGFNNIGATVCVYDPSLGSLGGLQYLDIASGFTATAMGGNSTYYTVGNHYPYVQSGNGFFVFPDVGGGAGSVTFTEAVKANNHTLVNRPSPAKKTARKNFNATVYFANGDIVDGNLTTFDNAYTNGTDRYDAFKIPNMGENFMIKRGDKLYAIESRRIIETTDSIFYTFNNIQPQTYRLKFTAANMKEDMLKAVLLDNYLKTRADISIDGETYMNFTIDANRASFENRFTVVFEKTNRSLIATEVAPPSNDNITSFSVYPNPVVNKELDIHLLNQPAGNYQLQLINYGGQAVHTETIKIDGKNATKTIFLNKDISTGNYQVVLTSQDNKKLQQQVLIK